MGNFNQIILKTVVLFSFLFLANCSSARFNINEVDFSYEYKSKDILPLKYHDRSNLSHETADKIMKGLLVADSSVWGYYHVEHSVDKTETKILDIGSIEFIVDIANILGFPKARVFYNLKAHVYLFDSNGDIVEIYEKSSSIMKYRGWYYGRNVPVKDMSEEYKKMFKEIIEEISAHKERTNNLLKLAGELTEDNVAETYTEVYKLTK
jgi:hypothetical protein